MFCFIQTVNRYLRFLNLGIAVCVCIMVASCTKNSISVTVESMIGQSFCFNKDESLLLNKGDFCKKSNSTYDYEYVFYYDSTQCTPCALNNIDGVSELKNYIAKERLPVQLTFVFAPSTANLDSFEDMYMHSVFEEPVFIDKGYHIQNMNTFMPKEHMYHFFLTDKSGKILLVGNPLRSSKLKKLMKQIIADKK